MKISKSQSLGAVSVLMLIALMSSPSEAFSFRNFIFRVVNVFSSTINRVVNVASSCSNSNVHGIRTECFDNNGNSKIRSSLDSLMAHSTPVKFKRNQYSAYQLTKGRIKSIANYESRQIRILYPFSSVSCSNNGSNLGCFSGSTTFLSAGGMVLDPHRLSAVLLHESEHANGSHNCGKADRNAEGPYGLEAFYLMSQYLYGSNLTVGEKEQAKASAASIANYKFCGNTVSRDEVLNYK